MILLYIYRRSGISCNILRGLGKDEHYYIGMPEQHMVTQWAAMFVDQEWRLAHIQWAMDSRKDSNQNRTGDEVARILCTFCISATADLYIYMYMNHALSKYGFLT